MNDDEAKALGMKAKALPGFSWQPRMADGNSDLTIFDTDIGEDRKLCVRWIDPNDGLITNWCSIEWDDWPDFRDPPTMGWLVHQVREASDQHVEVWLDTSCGWKATCWRGDEGVFTLDGGKGGYTSEIETWIAVLEDAAKR